TNLDDAVIFSSDTAGGDIAWPGATRLSVSGHGNISFWMATAHRDQPHAPATEAPNTGVRFGQWHAIGVSYGSQGQSIMLDGEIVASAPQRTQTFDRAGNNQQPLDVPAIGET